MSACPLISPYMFTRSRHQIQSPLRSSNGQDLLTDTESILNRWSEHFSGLLNTNRTVQEAALTEIKQRPVKAELDEPPDLQDIEKAIDQLKSGKAAGIDGIPPEIWKHGGTALHSKLLELLVLCWEKSKLPQDFRDAVIITLYKNKGEKSNCSNYRGITLLSIAGKILARILLNRLVPAIAKTSSPKANAGFEPSVEPLTWSLFFVRSKRNAGNKTWACMQRLWI